MARRSTKTERVLNLITSKNDEELLSSNVNSEILTEENEIIDEKLTLSEKIMNSLEETFLEETKDSNFEGKYKEFFPPPLKEAEEEALVEETSFIEAKEPIAVTEDSLPKEAEETAPQYSYINVMEEIVKDKAPEYINKFGMCSCGRCLVDVIAISLSILPPKYIVAIKNDNFPLLNYYSTKFSVEVSSALTRACMKVMSKPNHK